MPHICIVVASFYRDIAEELVRGAVSELQSIQSTYEIITVPGAFEIPSAINMAIASRRFQGYVALACVIRGETTHYDYVCGESARGLNKLALEHMAAIGYGILTVENPEQAWERASVDKGNKGRDATQACLAMCAIKQQMVGP